VAPTPGPPRARRRAGRGDRRREARGAGRYVRAMPSDPGDPGSPPVGPRVWRPRRWPPPPSPWLGDPRREDPHREGEGEVGTATRRKTARPPRYKVILYNDDYTPMEFVVAILEQIFKKGPTEATQIMLAIHRTGLGVAGVYVLDVAETKVAAVHGAAEQRGFPLRAGVEKE